MTDDDKLVDFMKDVAWRGIEDVQETINKIEDKATNIITFSGILMTIVGGLFVGIYKEINPLIKFYLILELVILIVCIRYAFKTIWLEKQEILSTIKTFQTLDFTDILKAKGDFAFSVGKWQERAEDIAKDKSFYLKNSMQLFIVALAFLTFSVIITVIFSFLQ